MPSPMPAKCLKLRSVSVVLYASRQLIMIESGVVNHRTNIGTYFEDIDWVAFHQDGRAWL